MASEPSALRALERAARSCGLNVAASRLTTGNHVLYGRLERALASFFRAPAATLVPTGYLTNLIAAQALSGQFSHALVDAASHPALRDAAAFLDCPALSFQSRGPENLAAALKRCGPGCRPILLTDGMFARDGSVAPLREYLKILPRDAMLLVDDAHGAGVIGANGRGSIEHCGVSRRRVVQTITLSKAFGAYGGAILSSAPLRKAIFARSTVFAGSTPLPPPLVGAAVESVSILAKNPGLRRRMHENAERVRGRLRDAGFDVPRTPGPVFALRPRNSTVANRLTSRLLEAGIYPSLLRYPGVPAGGLFRFVISNRHSAAQLDSLASAIEVFSPSDLSRP
jgi:7-keto-8-aminopelargonate synthetase-like enzyme